MKQFNNISLIDLEEYLKKNEKIEDPHQLQLARLQHELQQRKK
jgi:hypothetical protein